MSKVFGYVNGKECYSRDEFIYERRGFEKIRSDRFLLKYTKEVTSDWYDAGHHRSFADYHLGDYCLSEPMASLTNTEYERLKTLQAELRDKLKAEDDAREWRLVDTIYWADNSVEEIWRDKNGVEKTVMTVHPHGDAC